jgi:membrane protein YdbS with pleckstrin-like domain
MSEEVVLFRGSPSLLVKAGTFSIGILLIVGFIVGAVLAQQPLIAIGAGVVIVYLVVVAALIRTQVFEVTTERVKWRRGIFTKREYRDPLFRRDHPDVGASSGQRRGGTA